MKKNDTPSILDLDDFTEAGLYLLLDDGMRIDLTVSRIQQVAAAFWKDPEKIPASLKSATEFMPCTQCPHHGKQVLCKALMPLLPLVDSLDTYASYAPVTAVYKEANSDGIHVSRTSMQLALRFITVLCMMHYCEMGDRYRRYFENVMPLMEPQDIARHIFANIFLDKCGRKEEVRDVIAQLREDVFSASECLVKRLRSVCKNDALVNAFVATQIIVEYIHFQQLTDRAAAGDYRKESSSPHKSLNPLT